MLNGHLGPDSHKSIELFELVVLLGVLKIDSGTWSLTP
jgi:hypothetical protein